MEDQMSAGSLELEESNQISMAEKPINMKKEVMESAGVMNSKNMASKSLAVMEELSED